MGDEVDPDELTRSAGVADAETQSVHAWGLAEDYIDTEPVSHATPGRITAAAVVVSLALVATASVVVWRHTHDEQAPPPEQTAQGSATVSVPTSPPTPTPPWHLDGAYRFDIRNPEGIIRDYDGTITSMGDLGVSTLTAWGAYKTECEPSGCTARYVKLDDVTHRNAALDESGRKITHVDRWNGAEWESADEGPNGGSLVPMQCASGVGARTMELWTTLSSLPDGSFRGTTYRSEIPTNACGEMPFGQQEVPTTATRIGDIPPGIFDVAPPR